MSVFKNVPKGKMGYSPQEVEAFIALAREQYNNINARLLDWRDITGKKFTMVKGGFFPEQVDAAIDRLQDSFAERELKRKADPFAPSLSRSILTELREPLKARATRAKNRSFDRVNVMSLGYSRKEVDALLSVVLSFLNDEAELDISEIREITFKEQRGGYFESQVDAYIERLVEYLQTERFSEPVVVQPLYSSGGFGSSPSGFNNPDSDNF